MTHVLKLADKYWEAVRSGEKTFEVRYNDRGFQVGDHVKFRRVDSEDEMGMDFIITYVLTHADFPEGIPEGWCVFGMRPEGVGK
ncbi:DUF3850 domain-containing protein [uncultured Desulfovibrio sp.]|uniref:DUF3850 domain-containing protein n=1 Tax=uncultured Desulfovibrio sp. TaxID=167968 RepID=UPI0026232E86|nr:DUF3850 domain-containing protein [uncultured Desulfovibrio sp.]